VLQCVAVCCSVWQCVAVCCSVLQCVAVRCIALQCIAVCSSVLQCVAVCCHIEQKLTRVFLKVPDFLKNQLISQKSAQLSFLRKKVHSNPSFENSVVFDFRCWLPQHLKTVIFVCCSVLQGVAVCCSLLQCVAGCCRVLKRDSSP